MQVFSISCLNEVISCVNRGYFGIFKQVNIEFLQKVFISDGDSFKFGSEKFA